jgi:hypothetical protein
MKLFINIFLALFLITSCEFSAQVNETELLVVPTEEETVPKPELDLEKTRLKAKEALAFCKSKNYNQEFAILIDMSLHSGVNRLVIWDFKKDTVDHICLVGHGSGNHPWNNDFSKENPVFSNVENSHCSSLGKYRIGERAPSDWGVRIKYVIHGLEPTNSNAAKRFVVFHSWERVPNEELYPSGTPEGWGCPIVSLDNFRLIDEKLQSNTKSTLMWIYTI